MQSSILDCTACIAQKVRICYLSRQQFAGSFTTCDIICCRVLINMHTSIQILVQNWNKISTLTSVRLLYRAWVTPSSKTHTLTSTYQISIWYCMNRLSFCNIYVIQRDTQYLMILFITFNSSTCFGLQYSIFRCVLMLYVAIWYVSIRPVVMRVKEELQFPCLHTWIM